MTPGCTPQNPIEPWLLRRNAAFCREFACHGIFVFGQGQAGQAAPNRGEAMEP